MKKTGLLLAVLILTGTVLAGDNELTAQEKQNGWLLLFDGKTYNGWVNCDMIPPENKIEDGCINPHRAGSYMVVHERQWSDFILTLDYKTSGDETNSGVLLRANQFNLGSDCGWHAIEMQILDSEKDTMHATGALYGLAPGRPDVAKPVGQWNHAEITCSNNLISVVLNGVAVTKINLDDFPEPYKGLGGLTHKFDYAFRDMPRIGYIGLQDHGHRVWFKNIKLKPLVVDNQLTPYEKQNGWQLLFDGKTAKGWLTSDLAESKAPVENGCLKPPGSGSPLLVYEKQWDNFILSCDFKAGPKADGGIFLRVNPLKDDKRAPGYYGLKLPIDSRAPRMGYSAVGSIYQLAAVADGAAMPPEGWNHVEITCDNNRVRVMLNGMQMAMIDLEEFVKANYRPDGTYHRFDYALKDRPRTGYIALGNHDADVWFQNIKLKPLPSVK